MESRSTAVKKLDESINTLEDIKYLVCMLSEFNDFDYHQGTVDLTYLLFKYLDGLYSTEQSIYNYLKELQEKRNG